MVRTIDLLRRTPSSCRGSDARVAIADDLDITRRRVDGTPSRAIAYCPSCTAKFGVRVDDDRLLTIPPHHPRIP